MTTDVPVRFLTQQTGVISAFLIGAARSLLPGKKTASTNEVITQKVKAPSVELQEKYAEWAGATAGRYQGIIPPHLFDCQIALPMIAALTARSPYPLLSVLNQGVKLTMRHDIPSEGADLMLTGKLIDASDDGYRARMHSTIQIGTASHPDAMTIDAYAAVMLRKRPGGEAKESRTEPEWKTIGQWQAAEDEGRKFFYLTGDFNPIHTWPAFARRTQFKGCIMHGYGAFAQIYEAIRNAGWDMTEIETRFVKPLPLPSPRLMIQVGAQADAEGRIPMRLTDADNNLYQVGAFLPKGGQRA